MNKKEIINKYSNSAFIDFLENDNDGHILNLLDEEGLSILRTSPLKSDRLRYIFTYSHYKNELLSNHQFLKVFLSCPIRDFYASLNGLSFNTYNTIIAYCLNNKYPLNDTAELLSYFDLDYQIQFLDNSVIPLDLIYEMFEKTYYVLIKNKILEKYNIDLLSHDINLDLFLDFAKNSTLKAYQARNNNEPSVEISIPSHMINNQFCENLWHNYTQGDVLKTRKIINNLAYCSNPDTLEKYVAKEEDSFISKTADTIPEPFNSLLNKYTEYQNLNQELSQSLKHDPNLYEKYLLIERSLIISLSQISDQITRENLSDPNFITGLITKQYLNTLSDYIIDYHFHENYYNIMLDLQELMHFYYDGNIVLPEERIELYEQILNIDNLSIKEKQDLHQKLKQIDIISMFYDDMSLARHIVHESIKEYSLSSESLKSYKENKLSEEYGVDVYKMNGEYFFGIVKSYSHDEDKFPTGHSYSLIGSGGLATFGDPKDSETFLYDAEDLNPDQIVHVFPTDSFTLFRPFENIDEATNRVNVLALPDELVSANPSYNEILILENGKIKTEIDSAIPHLKKIALYCLDEITPKDIVAAKQNNVGIILINTQKYQKEDNPSRYQFRKEINEYNYQYLNESISAAKASERFHR